MDSAAYSRGADEVELMHQKKIRPAKLSDIATLVRHRRMMWWEMGRRDETALDLMEVAASEYFRAAVADGSYRGFLAEDSSGAVIGGGGIVVSPWPGVLGQRQPHRAMILNMYVEREHRRKGVARALMESMIAWCRQNEFAYVGLHASEQGRGLYEQLGFKPTDEMRLDLR
jgi:GNAT superfamily N-acetyltransferase